jgi:hypothetical protein
MAGRQSKSAGARKKKTAWLRGICFSVTGRGCGRVVEQRIRIRKRTGIGSVGLKSGDAL